MDTSSDGIELVYRGISRQPEPMEDATTPQSVPEQMSTGSTSTDQAISGQSEADQSSEVPQDADDYEPTEEELAFTEMTD